MLKTYIYRKNNNCDYPKKKNSATKNSPSYRLVQKLIWGFYFTALGADQVCYGKEEDKRTLVFHEPPKLAPYVYRVSEKTPAAQGYLPALLKYFADDHKIKLKYIKIPHKQFRSNLKQNKLDAAILHQGWVSNPNQFIFSQPLGMYNPAFISTQMNGTSTKFDFNHIKNATICTRIDSHHSFLDSLWKSNNLTQLTFDDELSQLKGLEEGNCQFAVMEEATAKWYIKRHFKEAGFNILDSEVHLALTIGFRKDKAEMAAQFDSTISRLRANGELAILQNVFGVEAFKE